MTIKTATHRTVRLPVLPHAERPFFRGVGHDIILVFLVDHARRVVETMADEHNIILMLALIIIMVRVLRHTIKVIARSRAVAQLTRKVRAVRRARRIARIRAGRVATA